MEPIQSFRSPAARRSARSVLPTAALLAAMLSLAGCETQHPAGGGRDGVPAPQEVLPPGISRRTAEVNGTRLRYLVGGQGSAVVLLHGFAQTSHMWLPLMEVLCRRHTVIAPDLRGAGDSDKPGSGYDKKTMAADVHALAASLQLGPASIVGHDIGLMVAYAYAAQYPAEVTRVVLMDAFLPGIGDWTHVWLLRDLWHFHFYGEVPEALVQGRERTYLEHFWNDFAADRRRSVPEDDRRFYAAAFAQPGAVHAGFEYFRMFERDAQEFAELGRTRLPMPMLVLTGEKASGPFLIEQAKLIAADVNGYVVPGVGHWLMEEARDAVVGRIATFVDGAGVPAGR